MQLSAEEAAKTETHRAEQAAAEAGPTLQVLSLS